MKKIFTLSIISLLVLSTNFLTFSQPKLEDEYASKKMQFWKMYEIYKSNLDRDVLTSKPVDPNGLFVIDDNNNFAPISRPFEGQYTNFNPVWTSDLRYIVHPWVWSQDTTTYTSIDGGVGTVQISSSTPGGSTDDQSFGPYPIGFAFIFDSVSYANFGVQANGWISMGSTAPSSSYTPISSGSTNNVIAGLAKDLYGLVNNGAKLMYQLSGSAPNRVLTVEWKNWGNYNTGLAEYNFQIKLYETTNLIRIHYGSFAGATTTSVSTQVGLSGAARTDFNNRNVPLAGNWSASTVGATNTAICYVNPPSLIPTNGLRWTWTQPAGTNNMAYTSSNTVQLLIGLPVAPGSINNQIIQVQVVTTGAASPFNVTSLNLGTDGSNNPSADIASAKVYFSGGYATFDTTRAILYGTYTSPNGTFVVNGNTGLATGTNYFWITYNILGGAVVGDSVDAQCNSITGSGSMGTVVPTTIAPAGSRLVDPYCLGTVSNAGCPYNIYISNVTFGSINNTTGCTGIMPYMYNNYMNLSTVIRINNNYGMTISIPAYTNPTAFGIWIDWNNNNTFADAGEYFASTVISSALTNPASVNILAPAGATIGNHRMRIRANLSTPPGAANYCATLGYGEQEDYTLSVLADTNMYYASSTTTQTNTLPVFTPLNNTQIIGIQINTAGTISPINASSFTLNTAGTSHPLQDITTAKLWYTGLNPNFAITTLYGSFSGPSGSFNVTNGSFPLLQGVNYFWLTYDIPSSAPNGDTVDAQCNSITVGGIARIPTVTSPAGFRIIIGNSLAGTYTIPGNYPSIAAAVTDLNTRGISGPVTFNVAAGYVESSPNLEKKSLNSDNSSVESEKNSGNSMELAANLTITTSGTAANPIIFQKSGSGANPIINAGVGTGTYDGVIKLYGVSYITFDGIDIKDTINTTTTTQAEWGYALLKPDGTHGNQNITIKNCNISLNKTNTATYGIYSANINLTGTAQTVSNPSGANSNNSFLSNNISNCYGGIYIIGYSDAAPYSYYDQNNTVSTIGGIRNSITNFGGSTTTTYGIYTQYQTGVTISNTLINSRGGINSSSTMYGIYNVNSNNSNVNITGDTITLADTTANTGTVYGIYNTQTTGNNTNITNNVFQDFAQLTTSGSLYFCYSSSTVNNLNISSNKIIGNTYGVAATSTGITYKIYNASSVNTSINISNNLDSGNIVNGTTAYTAYGIYNSVTTTSSRLVGNRIVNNTLCGTTATGTLYGIMNGSGTFSCVFDSNVVANNSLPTTSSSSMYFLYHTSTAPSMDYSYNTVTGNTGTGTGTFYSMYYSASPAVGSTVNITNNTITNQSKTTGTGTGTIYGIYQASTPQGTLNINNNTVTGFSSAAATALYGIYQASSPPNYVNINNNKVGNFTTGGASAIYGIYNAGTTTTVNTMSQDSVFNLTSLGGTIYGLYVSNGNPITVSRNSIAGITSSTSTTAVVYGLYIAGGVVDYVYNNFISNINAPASTTYLTPAVTGLYIGGGTNDYAYYNTIYLKDTSTSATSFGCAGIYASTTPNLDLRDNVVINNSTPGPTLGNVVAYWRSSTTLTTYLGTSNNNCFYAGTPGARNLIFYDGTNLDQTLIAFKTRVIPRDNNSATELPPFVNIAAPPYDLRIQTGTGTQLESGGQIISTSGFPIAPINITQDAFGTARYPNPGYPIGGYTPVAPDIGAHEFGGLNADLVPPLISYAPLGNGGTANRTFSNVIITDQSGVNTTAGTKPRCYYKRSTDSNVVNDTSNTTDGWKYVEATGTTSPFTFVIDYTKLVGGTGVTAGTVIQYFVIAQDLASTPNVGAVQATFATAPTSVNLTSSNVPITNTLSYTIGTNTFAGSYNVGSTETYTSLTGAAGIFAAINAGTVSGDITINITSDMTEDGTNQLNALNETGPGGYKVRIVPATASMKTIQGSVSQAMIRLNGVRNVTIDGNNGLGAKYLTFRNYYGTTPTIQFQNETRLDTIKNCIIESNNTGTSSGTIYFSTTTNTLGFGNDSICINSCDIRDRSDVTGLPCNAIYAIGSTTTLNTYNNWNSIINCNIYNNFYDAGTFTAGIYLTSGNSDWTISGNSFYQTSARSVPANSSSLLGIYSASSLNNDLIITNNYFGGSAPLCGGSPLTISGAGAFTYYGVYLVAGVLAPASIQGNTFQNFSLTYSGVSSSLFYRAVYISSGWANIGNLSGNTVGSGTGTGSITLTTNTTVSSYTIAMLNHFGFGAIMNNTIGSITFAGNSTGTGDLYAAIYWSNTTAGQIYTVSNNLIGSLTTPNSIQCTNVADVHALRGVYELNGAGTTLIYNNNIIANLTSFNNNAINISTVYGIQHNSASNGTVTMTGNTVRNLTGNCNFGSASISLGGLLSLSYGLNTFSQNTVYSLYANGTTGAQVVVGIYAGGASTAALGGTVSQNKIFDLRLSGAGTPVFPAPAIEGIYILANPPYVVSNNMVSLTNGDPVDILNLKPGLNETFQQVVVKDPPINKSVIPKDNKVIQIPEKFVNPVADADSKMDNRERNAKVKQNIEGKKDEVTSTVNTAIMGIYHLNTNSFAGCSYYYNTIYIGGTQPGGAYSSWCFLRNSVGVVNLRNNFFINARTGGPPHYCIGNEGATPVQGWVSTASNYNVLLGSSDATIGEWGLGNAQTLAQWVVSSGGDNQSWSTNTSAINPANLLLNIGTCDLRIVTGNSSAWILSGKGIAIAGQNIDYEGNSRVTTISGGCTDIGADEFTATPPSNPVAVQIGTISSGGITSYKLWGRTVCSVEWGLGGTSYPTSMNVNYYSGINPTNNSTLGPYYSNSYWTVVPVGSLAGTTYNITFYFGDNETYTITSPSTNTILANSNNTFWQAFPSGSAALQSNLNWSALTVNPTGLNNLAFSAYALTDGSTVPRLISPPHNAVNQPTTDTLTWSSVTGATSYYVQLGTDSTFNTGVIVNDSTVTGTTRVVSGLTLNVSYFWRVKAKIGTVYGPFTAPYKFRTGLAAALLGLTVIPGGFYNTSINNLNMKDTVRVILVDSATCLKKDSAKVVIDSVAFSATATYLQAPTGRYYIYVFHRNHIAIASRYTQQINTGSSVSYDFTTDSAKAYGFNMIKVSTSPVRWGMIPGDANKDGYVDGLDQTVWILQNGLDGYLEADFNGDLYVDGLDQTIWIFTNGQSYIIPCELSFEGAADHLRRVPAIKNKEVERIFSPERNKK